MRVAAWQDALHAIYAAANVPFRWGSHDCCQFAARCVAAVTGTDHRLSFPAYKSKRQAQAILNEHGGMRAFLEKSLGQAVHPSRAMCGDIVLIDMGQGEQPAVCLGIDCCAPGRSRLEFRKTLSATAAWMI